MHICEVELGPNPWQSLESGRVRGELRWDGGLPVPVSVAIRGAHSRKFPRRSLQLAFREAGLEFGPPAGHQVRRLHLNADYIDPTRMRSRLCFGLFEAVGAPAPVTAHVALTLTGEFTGVYVGLESVDADFCRRRGWEPGPIFYAINRDANFGLVSPFTRRMKERLDQGYQPLAKAGTEPLQQMLTNLNLASPRSFGREAERWFDVEGYLRWLMVAVFVGNRDGFVHNYALHFAPAVGRFRIIPWDYDATFGIDVNGRPARLDRVPASGWNKLTHRLLEVPRYREAYRSRFLSALDGPFAPDEIAARIDKMRLELAPWIDKDQQLQGLEEGSAALLQWAGERRELLRRLVAEL